MMIAVNGPEGVNCYGVVNEAMAMYWSASKKAGDREGHWVRETIASHWGKKINIRTDEKGNMFYIFASQPYYRCSR